ncbi:MAG: YIP1 family protein [Methanomicrobiales archaeon]
MVRNFVETVKGFITAPVVTFQRSRDDSFGQVFTYFIILLLTNAILTTVIVIAGMSVSYLFWAISGLGQVYPVIFFEYFFGGGVSAVPQSVFLFLFVGGIVGVFVCSAWLHLFVRLLGGRKGYLQTLKSLMYGMTPTLLLGWVPYISFIGPVWSFVLEVLGIRELQEMSVGKAVAAVLVAMVVAVIIIIVISAVLLLSLI